MVLHSNNRIAPQPLDSHSDLHAAILGGTGGGKNQALRQPNNAFKFTHLYRGWWTRAVEQTEWALRITHTHTSQLFLPSNIGPK